MSELEESFEDGVLTLTMNRPHARNAMGGDMMEKMQKAVPRAAVDPEVRCLVLTGAGGAFCAGGDVKSFASHAGSNEKASSGPGPSLETRVQGLRQGMEVSKLLHTMPKPTLAIIPGAAAGAGLSLALACDMRFCLDTAKITTAFSKIGASGDYGGSYFLPQLVGASKARELYFSADVISGQEAYDIGMMTKVASADTFEEESRAYAKYLASLPTVAIGYMKKNLNAAQNATLSDVFDLEAAHMMRTFMTDDHKAAAVAFVNKQAPEFKGR
jgi:2-(1,2-epoxy-1,2-dihydrophenyl)acetyl-CoA isomerase